MDEIKKSKKKSSKPKSSEEINAQKSATVDRKNEIYEILGISSRAEEDTPYHQEPGPKFEAGKPTGAIQDNYSLYPKDPSNWWHYFRIYTIIGIVTMAGLVCSIVFGDKIASAGLKSKSSSSYSYSKPVAKKADKGKGTLPTVSVFNGNTLDAPLNLPYKTKGKIYFAGKIDYKYGVHVFIDTKTKSGYYYYDRNGARALMKLSIMDYYKSGSDTYYLRMYEYSPQGAYCGEWSGTMTRGEYSGSGNYMGRYMPFNLTQCPKSQTAF